LVALLLLILPLTFEAQSTRASPAPLSEVQTGVIAQDSLTTGNMASWTFYGDAVQEHAPYTYSEDPGGLHIGIKAAKQGQWGGFYAESPNTNGELFHAVLTLPYSSIPSGEFNTGLYVQTSTDHINYVVCGAQADSSGYYWSVVYTTGNSRSAQKFYQVYYQPGGAGVPLTQDCTIVTNGQNLIKVYLDGQLVYSSTTLKLQMPPPFDSYLEVESTYSGGMLFGTYTDYYATTSENVQILNAPTGDTAEIVDSNNGVLATAAVDSSGTALLDVGQYHMPISGNVEVYDSSNSVVATTNGPIAIWGGDAYQSGASTTSSTSSTTSDTSSTSTSISSSSSTTTSTTSSTTSSSTSTTTSTTSSTNTSSQTPSLTVQSADQNGNPITGYYITLYDQNYKVLQTGYTTVTFSPLIAGMTYIVEADGYASCSFNHWQDTGSTNYQRTFVATNSPQTLTAVYSCV